MSQLKISEMPQDDRPREKLLTRGASALTDAELIAILLRTGLPGANAVQVAAQLLQRFKSLNGLSRCTVDEIAEIPGIGPAKALHLVAAFNLGQRLAREALTREKIDSPELVYDLLAAEMRALHKESLRVILLDTRYHLLRIQEVSLGSVNESIAHPRDVFRPAVISSAYAVIVAHNHPSGDPSPSQSDHSLTRRLAEAAELLQIRLLDHIIIGAPAEGRPPYFSFKEAGVLLKIHPSAVVGEGALIAEDVEIGPFSVIGSEVVIGVGSVVQSHVVIEGAVQIGAHNVIGHGSIIGGPPQDLGFKPETKSSVTIGGGNVLREHCTIHRGTTEGSSTTLGDRNFLMVGVHVGHNCRIANDVIIANNCLLAGYVEIADRAFIGGGTTFHQNMKVGRLVMAQGSSAFGKDIPPFLLAAERNFVFGMNVLGMRRAGFTGAERDEIKRAFKLLYRSGLNTRQALEQAAATEFGPLGREFFEFVGNAKKRGILPYRYAGEEGEA